MKLYEISENYRAFLEALENDEIPEEAKADTLEAIEGELNDKADQIACVIKNMRAEAEAITAEIDKLKERCERKKSRVEWLENYLTRYLEIADFPKIETPRNVISFRKSERVIIDNEAEFIEAHKDLCSEKVKVEISRTNVKKLLKNGEAVSGAILETRMNISIK